MTYGRPPGENKKLPLVSVCPDFDAFHDTCENGRLCSKYHVYVRPSTAEIIRAMYPLGNVRYIFLDLLDLFDRLMSPVTLLVRSAGPLVVYYNRLIFILFYSFCIYQTLVSIRVGNYENIPRVLRLTGSTKKEILTDSGFTLGRIIRLTRVTGGRGRDMGRGYIGLQVSYYC